MFLAPGDHKNLLSELQSDPLIFDGTRVWVIPYEHESSLALRLDSKVYLYEGNQSVGYTVYQGYAMRGGAPITKAGPFIDLFFNLSPPFHRSGIYADLWHFF